MNVRICQTLHVCVAAVTLAVRRAGYCDAFAHWGDEWFSEVHDALARNPNKKQNVRVASALWRNAIHADRTPDAVEASRTTTYLRAFGSIRAAVSKGYYV